MDAQNLSWQYLNMLVKSSDNYLLCSNLEHLDQTLKIGGFRSNFDMQVSIFFCVLYSPLQPVSYIIVSFVLLAWTTLPLILTQMLPTYLNIRNKIKTHVFTLHSLCELNKIYNN